MINTSHPSGKVKNHPCQRAQNIGIGGAQFHLTQIHVHETFVTGQDVHLWESGMLDAVRRQNHRVCVVFGVAQQARQIASWVSATRTHSSSGTASISCTL